jgi:general secretion pathway protein A
MYTSFFGLNEKPFAITPDPRYLFMSERHGEALAHLVYGVTESGGFMQLTGEVGTGKTTLVRTLLQNKLPNNADVAVVLNPRLSVIEFLETICEELGILAPEIRGSVKALVDALNGQLLKAHADGRRVILVVDEAQNLSRDVLEQVRLLTNLETAKQKLLQIILIGQPELRDLLAREDLRQLAQRITGRYHLEPLSRDETAQYIEHRLRVAGALGEVFDSAAKREVYRLTEGVPRLINVICDRALLGAYSKESRRVNRRLVLRAATVHDSVSALGITRRRRSRHRRHRRQPVAIARGTRRPAGSRASGRRRRSCGERTGACHHSRASRAGTRAGAGNRTRTRIRTRSDSGPAAAARRRTDQTRARI